jgi:diacylglycerol O-acyltransferase/trehalose O-mycolyltransferase
MKNISRASGLAAAALLAACGSSDGGDGTLAGNGLPRDAYAVDDAACPAPRCFEFAVPVPEGVNITDNRVRVILPAGYARSGKRYPLLYLLHDAPGDYTSWTRLGKAMEYLQDLEVIAVMPDGGGGNPGWYSDWQDGSFQWETYHMDVMMPFVEQRLRGLGDGHRAVAGPSMGGYGAMIYSAKHPGLFEAAASFSSPVDFLHLDRISALYSFLGNPLVGTPGNALWGDPITHYANWQAQDPGSNMEGLAGMRLLVASGNGLPGGPHGLAPPQYYLLEPLVLLMSQSFAGATARAGVDTRTLFYGPGFHDWPCFLDGFEWALPQMMEKIAP